MSLINVEREYFVYEGQEVIKTGRVATKEHDAIGWQGSKKVLETVCEITPVVQQGEYAYKKWVKESELFVINDTYADQELTDLPIDDLRIEDNPAYDAVDDILKQLRDRNQDGPKT